MVSSRGWRRTFTEYWACGTRWRRSAVPARRRRPRSPGSSPFGGSAWPRTVRGRGNRYVGYNWREAAQFRRNVPGPPCAPRPACGELNVMDFFRYRDRALFCEDVPVADLAAAYGTPLFVYSQATLLHHLGELQRSFAPADPLICYSLKTNPNIHVGRLM